MLLSAYEIASQELRRAAEQRARQAPTPQHEAAAAALAADQGDAQPAGDSPAGDTAVKAFTDAQAIPQPASDCRPHPFVPPVCEPGHPHGEGLDLLGDGNRHTLMLEHPDALSARMSHVTGDAPVPVPEAAGKAFRDAVPGPDAFPAPSAMIPDRARPAPAWQPGQAAVSPGTQPPGLFPPVPRGTLNAADFRHGPLTAGHAAPSPSHLEGQ